MNLLFTIWKQIFDSPQMSKNQVIFSLMGRRKFHFEWKLLRHGLNVLVNDFFHSHLFLSLLFQVNSFYSLFDFSGSQGNPVGQSGLGMAYLYGRGVQVVSVQSSILTLISSQLMREESVPWLVSSQPRWGCCKQSWAFSCCLWVSSLPSHFPYPCLSCLHRMSPFLVPSEAVKLFLSLSLSLNNTRVLKMPFTKD
jgi:hypothetical protein